MRLFWHRRDLRAADNRGLDAAADGDTVAPAFVFDTDVLTHAGASRVAFMLDALAALRAAYRDRGSDLLVARGDPRAELPRLAEEVGADAVHYSEDYSGLAQARDEAVEAALADAGLDTRSHRDAVHHEPGAIRTNDGDPYQVFTYFSRKWQDRAKEPPAPAPEAADLADVTGDQLPDITALGFEPPAADIPEAGTAAARERLDRFCEEDLFRYEEARERPAERATSRLSADLKFGTIGVRAVTERVAEAARDAEEEPDSVDEFRQQLAWREFYTQVLYFNPETVTRNYKQYESDIEWREDPEALRAWKRGETGFPIVDAGMRQLRSEAFMHNRLRMVVASFLTKDLLIDWRRGYEHFREHLVDHDTANDVGGWQWAASTGTDAQPYFRVFNPVTQGESHDPDAVYIREHVPELADCDPETIHAWTELSSEERGRAAPGYPAPIVDHAECRERAISAFERARGD
jgi:deoxyribodipyrimidine photo-lyase